MPKISSCLNMLDARNRPRGPELITTRGAWSCGPKKIYVDPEVHPKGLNRQCYMCKKVEMNGGTWAHILHDRAETNHCLCPVCAPKEMARVIQTAEEVNNQFAVLEPVL